MKTANIHNYPSSPTGISPLLTHSFTYTYIPSTALVLWRPRMLIKESASSNSVRDLVDVARDVGVGLPTSTARWLGGGKYS